MINSPILKISLNKFYLTLQFARERLNAIYDKKNFTYLYKALPNGSRPAI